MGFELSTYTFKSHRRTLWELFESPGGVKRYSFTRMLHSWCMVLRRCCGNWFLSYHHREEDRRNNVLDVLYGRVRCIRPSYFQCWFFLIFLNLGYFFFFFFLSFLPFFLFYYFFCSFLFSFLFQDWPQLKIKCFPSDRQVNRKNALSTSASLVDTLFCSSRVETCSAFSCH